MFFLNLVFTKHKAKYFGGKVVLYFLVFVFLARHYDEDFIALFPLIHTTIL